MHPPHTVASVFVHLGSTIFPVINQLLSPLRDSTDSLATLTTTRLFPFGPSPFAVQPCHMLDDPKPLSAGAGRKRPQPRRVLVITNPNDEAADSSTRSFLPLPPLPNAPLHHLDKPTPSPPQPSPIKTDNLKQKYQPRSNPSDRTLSSPSTPTSSPALESTPPPSTPGQKSIPSIDLAQSSDRDNFLISRTDNPVKQITALTHVRRKSSGNNLQPAAGSVRPAHFGFLCDPPDVTCLVPHPSRSARSPNSEINPVHKRDADLRDR